MRTRFTGICYACGHFNETVAETEDEVIEVPCQRCRLMLLLVADPPEEIA